MASAVVEVGDVLAPEAVDVAHRRRRVTVAPSAWLAQQSPASAWSSFMWAMIPWRRGARGRPWRAIAVAVTQSISPKPPTQRTARTSRR